MKKLLSLFVVLTISFGLCSCAKQAKPEDTVKNFFEAVKASDSEKMNTYVSQNSGSSLSSSASTSSGEEKVEKELSNYFKDNMKKIAYNIKSSEINGNSAIVTVDCKYIDGSSIIKDTVTSYLAKIIAQAITGANVNSSTAENEFEETLSDKIKNTKETFINKTIKINCVKTNNKWYISKIDDDLQNVLLSNFMSIKNDLSKLSEGIK
jgi:hypothetical protein